MNSIFSSVASPPRARTPVEEDAFDPRKALMGWTEDPAVLDNLQMKTVVVGPVAPAEEVEEAGAEPIGFEPSLVTPARVERGEEQSDADAFGDALDRLPLEVHPEQEANEAKAYVHALDAEFDPLAALAGLFFPPKQPTPFEASDDLHQEIEKLHQEAVRREVAEAAAIAASGSNSASRGKTVLRPTYPLRAAPGARSQEDMDRDAYDELRARQGGASDDALDHERDAALRWYQEQKSELLHDKVAQRRQEEDDLAALDAARRMEDQEKFAALYARNSGFSEGHHAKFNAAWPGHSEPAGAPPPRDLYRDLYHSVPESVLYQSIEYQAPVVPQADRHQRVELHVQYTAWNVPRQIPVQHKPERNLDLEAALLRHEKERNAAFQADTAHAFAKERSAVFQADNAHTPRFPSPIAKARPVAQQAVLSKLLSRHEYAMFYIVVGELVDQHLLSEEEEGSIYEISDDDNVVVSYRTYKSLHNKEKLAEDLLRAVELRRGQLRVPRRAHPSRGGSIRL